jgi:hypothetical protein
MSSALTSCADEPAPAPLAPCSSPGALRSVVLSTFSFTRADPARGDVVDGFDLDDHASEAGDPVGCRQADFTSPEGERGVDNQIARLLPIVDSMTGGAFDGLIQGAVNNGQLLVAVSLDGVDDLRDDACVSVSFQRVAGSPFVGSDMRIVPDQTFDRDRGHPITQARARIRGGVLETEPFDLPLPVAALDARFTLNIRGAHVRARVGSDGSLTGVVGGGLSVSEFGDIIRTLGIGDAKRNAFNGALRIFADLGPDAAGACQQISLGMRFEARPAFVNP